MSIYAIPCPKCGSKRSRVLASRQRKFFDGFRRRRQCHDCGLRYFTVETLELARQTLDVVQRSGCQ